LGKEHASRKGTSKSVDTVSPRETPPGDGHMDSYRSLSFESVKIDEACLGALGEAEDVA
jgi:hypothetical protein